MAQKMRSLTAIETYNWYRQKVFGPSPSINAIPNTVLRNYLDALAIERRIRPGLHNITITVMRNSDLSLLVPEIILTDEIDLRVEGQKWQ